jgi:hypothetical protein
MLLAVGAGESDAAERKERTMRLVERHVIKRADPRFAPIDAAAFASKNLYNAANYEVRQSFIAQSVYLDYYAMHERMKTHEVYKALPAKVAQWVLRLLDQNWQSYFSACAAWTEAPKRLLGRPRLPRYKDKQNGRNLLVYTIETLSVPALRQGLIVPSMLGVTIKTQQRDIQTRHPDETSRALSRYASSHAAASMWSKSSLSVRRHRQTSIPRSMQGWILV